MLEFVLVFPVLLFLVLILAQTALLMGANLFVHYAAFAATRSAIVQVPSDHSPDEGQNVVINSPGHAKHDAIRRAAVFAVVPISGRIEAGDTGTDDYTAGLTHYYNAYGQTPPSWITRLAADRLRYADANTLVSVRSTTTVDKDNITFADLPEAASYTFGAKEPVTVQVTHRLRLSVPYVGMFFANGTLTSGTGRYTLVTAQYTLTNEGVFDALPPKPTLQRDVVP